MGEPTTIGYYQWGKNVYMIAERREWEIPNFHGYELRCTHPILVRLPVLELTRDGVLTVHPLFSLNFASGPTPRRNLDPASIPHDCAFFAIDQLTRRGFIEEDGDEWDRLRNAADDFFGRQNNKFGVRRFLRRFAKWAVRLRGDDALRNGADPYTLQTLPYSRTA